MFQEIEVHSFSPVPFSVSRQNVEGVFIYIEISFRFPCSLPDFQAECGSGFTSKLEGMFKDIDLSRDVMISFGTSPFAQQVAMSIYIYICVYIYRRHDFVRDFAIRTAGGLVVLNIYVYTYIYVYIYIST